MAQNSKLKTLNSQLWRHALCFKSLYFSLYKCKTNLMIQEITSSVSTWCHWNSKHVKNHWITLAVWITIGIYEHLHKTLASIRCVSRNVLVINPVQTVISVKVTIRKLQNLKLKLNNMKFQVLLAMTNAILGGCLYIFNKALSVSYNIVCETTHTSQDINTILGHSTCKTRLILSSTHWFVIPVWNATQTVRD